MSEGLSDREMLDALECVKCGRLDVASPIIRALVDGSFCMQCMGASLGGHFFPGGGEGLEEAREAVPRYLKDAREYLCPRPTPVAAAVQAACRRHRDAIKGSAMLALLEATR